MTSVDMLSLAFEWGTSMCTTSYPASTDKGPMTMLWSNDASPLPSTGQICVDSIATTGRSINLSDTSSPFLSSGRFCFDTTGVFGSAIDFYFLIFLF
jgi:hypothetical protein